MERLKQFVMGIGFGKAEPTSPWHAPKLLDRGHLGEACLALEGQGRGSALWENAGNLWTMHVGQRSSPALVRLPLGEGTAPQIQLNPEGHGLALWLAEAAGERQILGKILGGHESGSHVVFRTEGQIRHLQGAVDRRGNALVVWLLEQEGRVEVKAQSFDTRGQAWEQGPTTLGIPSALTAVPRMAANHREHAMVLWEAAESEFEGLVASHYWPKDRIWSDRPVPVVSHATQHHQVVMDDAGNALAIWVHAPYGQRSTLEASYYQAGGGEWGEPIQIGSAHAFSNLRLVMSGEGEALAAWCQAEGHGVARLVTKRFQKEQWVAGLDCFELGHGPVKDYAIVLGSDGQAGILAVQHGIDGDRVSAQLRRQNWSSPMALAAPSKQACSSPRLSLGPRGASALWIQGVGRDQALFLAETR